MARALARNGRTVPAHRLYLTVLRSPLDLVDDQGIPFALYAPRRLTDSPHLTDSEAAATIEVLQEFTRARPVPDPAAVHMAADVAAALENQAKSDQPRVRAMRIREDTERLVRAVEHALAVQYAFPSLLARARSVARSENDVIWVPHAQPDSVWLVGIGGGEQTVIGVCLSSLVASRSGPRVH